MEVKREREVVMLATEKASNLYLCVKDVGEYDFNTKKDTLHNSFKTIPSKEYFIPQHLYILSDDEIKVGYWYLHKENFLDGTVKTKEQFDNAKWILSQADKLDLPYIGRAKNGKNAQNGLLGILKVIATTDESLGFKCGNNIPLKDHLCTHKVYLPSPSPQFIESFVESHNNGKPITKVMVSYEDRGHEGWIGDDANGEPIWIENYVPKVDKNNHITITKVKDTYTTEEVIELIKKFDTDTTVGHFNGPTTRNKWIEQNL